LVVIRIQNGDMNGLHLVLLVFNFLRSS